MRKEDIRYEVYEGDLLVEDFDNKEEAINFAIENNFDCVEKFDNFNFENLGTVWENDKPSKLYQ